MALEAIEKGNPDWALFQTDIYEAIKQGMPVTEDQIQIIRDGMDEQSFAQNYLCSFLTDDESYFSNVLLNACVDQELENYALSKIGDMKGVKLAGYDPGKKVDSGVFTILGRESGSGKIKVLYTKEYRGVKYTEQIRDIVRYCKTAKISKLYVDCSGGASDAIGDFLIESLGSIVDPLTYTNDLKEELIINI